MKTIEEIIGTNVRERRSALGMTQSQLGKAAGLTIQTLGKIEKGKRAARTTNLEAIAQALNCTREDLLKNPDEKPGPTVTSLLEAIAAADKENQELRARLTEVNRVIHMQSTPDDILIEAIKKKFTQEQLWRMAHSKDMRLEIIKSVIDADASNLHKLLAELISKRKSSKGSTTE